MYKIYSKGEAKEETRRLVEQFESDFGNPKNPHITEAQLKDKYIKPFLPNSFGSSIFPYRKALNLYENFRERI